VGRGGVPLKSRLWNAKHLEKGSLIYVGRTEVIQHQPPCNERHLQDECNQAFPVANIAKIAGSLQIVAYCSTTNTCDCNSLGFNLCYQARFASAGVFRLIVHMSAQRSLKS